MNAGEGAGNVVATVIGTERGVVVVGVVVVVLVVLLVELVELELLVLLEVEALAVLVVGGARVLVVSARIVEVVDGSAGALVVVGTTVAVSVVADVVSPPDEQAARAANQQPVTPAVTPRRRIPMWRVLPVCR